MRSIHKKTLKRFLSTLLAVVMVLGMVPFTALAAPPEPVTLTQSNLEAKITPSEPNPAAVTAGNQSTVTYTVEIAASAATATGKTVKLTIDGTDYDFGAVTIDGSTSEITSTLSMPTGLTLSGGKITGAVTKAYDIGSHTVPMYLTVGTLQSATETPTITVPRKAVITRLTAAPSTVTAGEDFTVTATSDVAEGYVKFTYGADVQRVAVIPDENGKGIASATFTAAGTAGTQDVTALQYAMTGVVDSDVKTTTITLGAADTYYDVTFLPGAADAYIPFTPTTVSVKSGDDCAIPTGTPTRPGYVFAGWDSDNDGTANIAATAPATGTVSGNMTLNALWTRQAVTVSLAALDDDVTTWPTSDIAGKVGDTVRFNVTIPAKYNTADVLVWAGNSVIKYPSPVAQYYDTSTGKTTLYYEFEITEDLPTLVGGTYKLPITVGKLSLNQYTVMMPVGHFTAKITAANGATITPAAASASINHGGSYTFTVTPASGYEIKGVYVNGAVQTADSTGADGTQTFIVTDVTSAQTVEVVVDAVPSYTVTYVVNDAQYTTQKVTSGSAIGTLPDDPVVDGYTFDGWYTKQNGSGTQVTDTTTVTNDMTVYAQLTPVSYTITYKDGTSVLDTQTKTHGVASSLSADVPTKAGHTFLGWGTTAAATTATYQPGDMYSTEGSITLYAVWKINTFTVTLPNGTGYTAMPAAGSSSPVDYGKNFTFTVTVDPEYAVATPVVNANGILLTTTDTRSPYTYTINNITADQVVSIQVTKNPVHTVTFQYTLPGSGTATVYQTQQVEHNAKATQPAPPSVEGYTFGGWYSDTGCSTAFNFSTAITGATTVYGKMTAITPKVTYPDSGTGWTLGVTNPAGLVNGGNVTYKSSVEFTVIISTGYDATNLAVAANGLALAPVEVNGNTYKFVLPNITADQKITVTGVARKMITITYNDNGGIGGPGQEQVKYYLSDTDCGKISNVVPTRVGYTFLGWAKANPDGTIPTTADYSNPAKTTAVDGYDTSDIANFTTDTTLYAVWSAKTTTVTLTVDKTSQYEGEKVVLTADVKSGAAAVTSGSVQFYRYTGDPTNDTAYADENNWKLLDSKVLSGGKAVLEIATSDYVRAGQNKDSYKAVFVPNEGAGYSTASSTDPVGTTPAPKVTVNVLSTAISWKLNGGNIATDGNKLTVYKGTTISDSTKVTDGKMTAGNTYTLVLPDVYALDDTTYNETTKLVVNKDYTVIWQYLDGANGWQTYTEAQEGNTVKILPDFAKYQFRAMVKPLTGATGHFTQAAKYSAATDTTPATLIANQYVEYLLTEATNPVAQQETKTKLTVTGTHNLGSTIAEFEGQKVTLTATVTLSGSTTKVTTGEVYFYKVGSPNTLIGKANVQSDGTAVLEATMSTYSAGAKDTFRAVYQENATYDDSTSSDVEVLIRSTAIAWAKDTSGAEVKTLTVNPIGSIYADNKYTLTLPAIKEEGQAGVTLDVGTDYVVSWYMVKADNTVVLLAENTESNTYTVVPPTAGVTYYAVVSPKAGSNYTDAYEGTTTKNFLTSAETAASVKAPTVTTITFGDVKTDTGKIPDFSQYEEKTITITAKVVEADFTSTTTPLPAKNPEELVKSGTVTFYVVTDTTGNYEKIGTATVSNGLATVSYTLPEYDLADGLKNIEYFFAVYSDTAGTYADSNTTENGNVDATVAHTNVNAETEAVQILSTTISWKLDGDNKIVAASATTPDANKLTIYVGNGTSGTVVDTMTAGSTYTLELPAVYALDDAQNATNALTVNKDYTVVWQYREFGASDWNNYPNASAGNTVLITPDYSGYQFQAVVTPVYDNAALTGYKTAAAYNASDVATGKTNSLITDPTEKTELQATTTDLAITGAVEEAANQVLFGETKFGWGNHLVQYENQTVTLKATVTDNATSLGVNSVGKVYFYRYTNDSVDNNDVLLNANGQGIEVGPDGIATMNYTMPAYDSTKVASAEENCSRIYAVYVEGVTYDTSASVSFTTDTLGVKTYGKPNSGLKNMVFSMSTTIKTPIIDSTRANADGKTATTYTADLTGLLAGVEHKFTLRTGASTADWSVVALDGRTVDAENYDIQWNVKTGDNTVTDATVGGTFTTSNNKVGDEISVTLIAKNDMKVDATSKKAIIGTKQDVNVTVTASDEIASTTDTDVYQLNPIILTATVAAKETNATVKPTGTVAFYYKDGTNWVYLDEAVLTKDTDGQMRASITTDKLPVTGGTNVKRDVEITAVYLGDETFNESGTISGTTITTTTGCTVTNETVTVYSSVVYVDAAENTTNTPGTDGITISAEEGKVLANETNVNLKLSDVYTLDHNIDLSKLAYGVDYTVQWQQLSNAASYTGAYAAKTTPWVNIDGATGVTCQITVKQGAAYRAMITVKDTPIVKGSYTFVDQGTVGTADIKDGRQVYYSNILVANPAPPTVTVNVNTSNTADGFEGIVEGETVTIHTFASGASGTTPISELTATITDASGAEVDKQVKTNVNGHVSFDWTAAKPGYYTLKVVAKFTNGYSDKEITRTLIVRDNDYGFNVTRNEFVYDGQVQGLELSVTDMGIEDPLAQKSVVVYYYDKDNKQVEPTQAGTYKAVIRLQESAYWTEKKQETTLTIKQREVSVVDLIAQAKVYDGTTNANIQEIILNDAVTAQTTTGLPTGDTGIINGDSVYAEGTGYTASANAGATTLGVKDVTLKGNDAANYKLADATYTEAFNIQRSQVKGDIADSTFQYTGSNITVPADDIYLIDQAGNVLTPADYTVTYYYHNGDGVEKVTAMNKLGKYTVIARPEQTNYKGGASETVYVVSGTGVPGTLTTYTSALIDITNTVELFGAAGNTGIVATATNGATTTVGYWNGTTWGDRPTDAGRYLVKVTASTGDTAYGIYTIVKANPALELTATGAEYTSAQISGTPTGTFNGGAFPTGTYFTYAGGTIQGVAYEAPTEVGTYIVTAHVPETDNYTTHEISDQFKITPKALTITADSLQRRQYGAFPDMTASFDGLAGSAYAPDTSLRDVQIQPELIFNETDGYDNIAMDHVGNEYPIIAIAALARNYDVSYVNGNLSVTRDEPNPYLAIHGMIDNGNGGDIAYYGDVIQLYAYGSQMGNVINNSSVLTWSVTGPATITQDGLLTITGVGTVEVKLTRGVGAQKISTTLPITALKKELKVSVPDEDVVYNAATQTYTVSNMKAYNEKFATVTGVGITSGNTDRIPVGSQIVTGQVASTETYYQSETYGGLFTINDKEATVKPTAKTTTYGTPVTGLTYTEVTPAGSDTVLTNGKAVSVADQYGNLDVGTYEILVAGAEDMNYNVKYTTAAAAATAKVTAKSLIVSTGTLDANVGMTSGSLNPAGDYPAEGAVVDPNATLGASNVRMYGEPNWVMDFDVWTDPNKLITGDSLADLATLPEWLMKFDYTKLHNIAEDANLEYPTPQNLMTGKSNYSIDSSMSFGNYTVSKDNGTQNIYQRPVTLALSNRQSTLDIYFTEILASGGAIDVTKLRNIIINNVEAGKYNNEGGLAELLKHTVKDLDLQVTTDFTTGATQFTATVTVGNQNYWLGNAGQKFDITVNILYQRLTVDYTTFTATFSDVILYEQTETTRTPAYATGDVTFIIYRYVEGQENYSYYAANETAVVSELMTMDTSRTGRYYVTYPKLSAGTYRMFAVASGYTIID